jgi:hypothetical protein
VSRSEKERDDMGTEYNSSLGIGFRVRYSQLLEKFGRKTSERFHMEDRFDPKTGKKTGPVKVIDQEEMVSFIFDGEDFQDDVYALVEAIQEKVGCAHYEEVDETGLEDALYVFGPNIRTDDEDTFSYGRFNTYGPMMVRDIVAVQEELVRIGNRLRAQGLDVGEPVVRIMASVG